MKMNYGLLPILALVLLVGAVDALATQAQAGSGVWRRPARQLFGYKIGPAKMRPMAIGSYARGCMAGATQLPVTGPAWQVMRLSRNRNWGLPTLIDYLSKLAVDAKQKDGWRGLLIGDMAQPRGGPMLTGHASHQIGLDADIWLRPMPEKTMSYSEREHVAAITMLAANGYQINPDVWTMSRARLIRRAASSPRVARIFVHPAIKKALCDAADKLGKDRGWLRRVRPWWGHHYHFHVRLKCPRGMRSCKNQREPAFGDGCGRELTAWLRRIHPRKKPKPKTTPKHKPKIHHRKRELTLASLPAACSRVLAYGDKGDLARLAYGVGGKIDAPVRNPRRAGVRKAQTPPPIIPVIAGMH